MNPDPAVVHGIPNCDTVRRARALLLAQPGLIKRPVVEWPDGCISVGFDAARWAGF